MTRLTKKRKAFIYEYLKDFNGTQAAIRAGYSENSARSTASKLLKIPTITNIIDQELEALKMDKDEALRLLAEMARSAKSESVKERALEKVIDIHDRAEGGGASELVLRVIREHGKDRSTHQVESSPPEAADDRQLPSEAQGDLHRAEVRQDHA